MVATWDTYICSQRFDFGRLDIRIRFHFMLFVKYVCGDVFR
jgi:hypothetical protein